MEDSKAFFTLTTIGTFAGASAAVALLGNTFRVLTGINKAWPPFVLSLVVSAVAAYELKAFGDIVTGSFLVVLNACLLFSSALGMQETALGFQPAAGGAKPQGRGNVRFWSGWFR